MKRLIPSIFALVFTLTSTWADPGQLFDKAGIAYTEGDLQLAIDSYDQLLKDGYHQAPVYFNLGNAHFRNGDNGVAIYNYKQAQRTEPRNSKYAANLDYALKQSNALSSTEALPAMLMRKVSSREWTLTASASWCLLALIGIAASLLPQFRFLFKRIALLAATGLVIALLGLYSWYLLQTKPEAVLLNTEQVLSAPLTKAKVLFELPEGSIPRISNQQAGWMEVDIDGKMGWLPSSSLGIIQPAN